MLFRLNQAKEQRQPATSIGNVKTGEAFQSRDVARFASREMS
jgi:hypothetical protein